MQTFSLFIYDIVIRLYGIGILIAASFNEKAKLWVEGRKTPIKLPQWEKGIKRIWFHCASLGEFEQARPVIEKIKKIHPEHKIILSFFSPSGYEIRKNYEYADAVVYLPLDSKENAQKFITEMKPDLALFVKYEFWYHYINELKSRRIPIILFSAAFRKGQIFFHFYGELFSAMLGMFNKILVQNKESTQLLESIGIESEIVFDTRFDRVYQGAENKKAFPLIEKFKGKSKIFIAGSIWEKDENLIAPIINENILEKYKYIIAPHDIIPKRLKAFKHSIDEPCIYFSELNETNAESSRVIIVDSIGQLLSLYAYGDIAYIGGGFNAGIHNVLEPAVYGLPVLFGPNYHKSVEAEKLITIAGAFSVSSYKDLLSSLRVIIERDRQPVNHVTALSKKYITDRLGGTEKVYAAISQWL